MGRRADPVFYAFDLLFLNDKDLRKEPLLERKKRLHTLVKKARSERLIYAQHINSNGAGLFEEICRRVLEGIVCKRRGSIYRSDGKGWLKVKNPNYSQGKDRQEQFQKGK
jgi:bifunctional non-homologous end joining protein LigD